MVLRDSKHLDGSLVGRWREDGRCQGACARRNGRLVDLRYKLVVRLQKKKSLGIRGIGT
jgi:hypothetical protein